MSNPTIVDARRARELLEAEIFNAASDAVLKFHNSTGLHPCDIRIAMTTLDTVGERRSYVISHVHAKIEL